jgi:hypothetical protein
LGSFEQSKSLNVTLKTIFQLLVNFTQFLLKRGKFATVLQWALSFRNSTRSIIGFSIRSIHILFALHLYSTRTISVSHSSRTQEPYRPDRSGSPQRSGQAPKAAEKPHKQRCDLVESLGRASLNKFPENGRAMHNRVSSINSYYREAV